MTTTIPDSHRDLLDQPVATLGTVDPEGRRLGLNPAPTARRGAADSG